MVKWLIVGLALVGAGVLVVRCNPGAFTEGPHVAGHLISYGLIALAVVAFLGYKLKSK